MSFKAELTHGCILQNTEQVFLEVLVSMGSNFSL